MVLKFTVLSTPSRNSFQYRLWMQWLSKPLVTDNGREFHVYDTILARC